MYDGVKKPSLSFLWSTFGTSTSCLDRFVKKVGSKAATLQIHASNGSCVRLGRCKAGEVDIRNKGRYQARIKTIKAYTDTLPSNIKPLLSLQLEDNLNHKQAVRALGWAREVWPGQISHNPILRTDKLKGVSLELHDSIVRSKQKGASIWSNDGIDVDFGKGCTLPRCTPLMRLSRDVLTHYRSLKHSFIWWNTQGAKDGRKFVEPRKRKISIRSDDVKAVNGLIRRTER